MAAASTLSRTPSEVDGADGYVAMWHTRCDDEKAHAGVHRASPRTLATGRDGARAIPSRGRRRTRIQGQGTTCKSGEAVRSTSYMAPPDPAPRILPCGFAILVPSFFFSVGVPHIHVCMLSGHEDPGGVPGAAASAMERTHIGPVDRRARVGQVIQSAAMMRCARGILVRTLFGGAAAGASWRRRRQVDMATNAPAEGAIDVAGLSGSRRGGGGGPSGRITGGATGPAIARVATRPPPTLGRADAAAAEGTTFEGGSGLSS